MTGFDLTVDLYDGSEQRRRVGFFTDTSVCIGCKACEVACKEWNGVPEADLVHRGTSMDNTGTLGADTWRHVAFIEQRQPVELGDDGAGGLRWLMSSDVCKHCTHAACLEVCPTGALFRTEFGTVVVQDDICNGCGYCVPACPFGVIDKRRDDGRAWKCTLCYDRLKEDQTPACAQACPTQSIQFGELDALRERADARVAELVARGETRAQLYLADPDDGIGGGGAFFLLLDDPEVYGLPPDPRDTTADLPGIWRTTALAAGALLAGVLVAGLDGPATVIMDGGGRSPAPGGGSGRAGGRSGGRDGGPTVGPAVPRSYYGQPILNRPVWTWEVPVYFFVGGMAGAAAPLALVASLQRNTALARAAAATALAGAALSPVLLISDLGRPGRFVNMLRVFKPTSPMSVGSWILAGFGPLAGLGAARELAGVLPRVGRLAQVGAAGLGPGLSTYTAALLANTAVPAWHEARDELPFVFAGSSLASAAGAALLLTPAADAAIPRRMAVLGAGLSLSAAAVMEHQLGELAAPYRPGGAASTVTRAAKLLSACGGLLVAGRARRHRRRPVVGALALLGGSALERWAIFRAGVASAGDPAATVGPQRARRDARERDA